MKQLIFVLSLLLASCATEQVKGPYAINPQQSEEFGSYLRLFREEASKRSVDLNLEGLRVYMVDHFRQDLEKEGVIGLCIAEGDKQKIYINKPYWNSYDTLQREMLLFHELGHCILELPHDESADESGLPEDIMYPVNFESSRYFLYRSEMLTRMFKKIEERAKNKTETNSSEKKVFVCSTEQKRRHHGPTRPTSRPVRIFEGPHSKDP